MNYQYFMNLFLYLLNRANKSFLYSNNFLIDNIKLLKKAYPYNVYIIDCCEYYNDEMISNICTPIIQKKKTIMNDYMNTNDKAPDTSIDVKIKKMNIIFILNIHTFSDSNKNFLQFINSLDTGDETSVFFVSNENIFYLLQQSCDSDFKISDFEKISSVKNGVSLPDNLSAYIFKTYKNLTKYKKNIFPFDKIKVTKKKTERYISNIVFIQDVERDKKIKTCDDFIVYNDMYVDYKKILINYLLCDDFNYATLFSVSHYENIPLILYENIEHIVGKPVLHMEELITKIRLLCLNYYSYNNDPDIYLFNKSNLYYFMFNFKKLLEDFKVEPSITNLKKLKFTKYYSNRASEIQCQNSIQVYSFLE